MGLLLCLAKLNFGHIWFYMNIFFSRLIKWIEPLREYFSESDFLIICIHVFFLNQELLLLGCIASRWNCLIEHFMHVSYYSLAISEQYHELCNLVFGRSQSLNSTDETMISKVTVILKSLV